MRTKDKTLDFTGQPIYIGIDVHTCVPKHFSAQAQKQLEGQYLFITHISEDFNHTKAFCKQFSKVCEN